jgi:hypothetical protein
VEEKREIKIDDRTKIVIEHIMGYDHDPDWIGKFSDKWEEGAIDRAQWIEVSWERPAAPFYRMIGGEEEGVYETVTRWECNWNKREYRWFIPECTPRDANENAKLWNQSGWSKHEAWVAGQQIRHHQKATMDALCKGDLYFIGIGVKILVDSLEVASASLWGIEDGWLPKPRSNWNHDPRNNWKRKRNGAYDQSAYHEEVELELIQECIRQLCGSADKMIKIGEHVHSLQTDKILELIAQGE